jgi:hypothetical protein
MATNQYPTLELIAGGVRDYCFDYTDFDEVELGGGTLSAPTIPAVSGITLGSPAVNVAIFSDGDGNTVAIGKGVVVKITTTTNTTKGTYVINCFATYGSYTLPHRLTLKVI